MKTKLKISLILLLAGIILASCNSSLSITKRRYNKGFYVHHNHKASTPKTRETAKAAPVQHENQEFLELAKATEAAASSSRPTEQPEQQILTASSDVKKKSAEGSGNISNKSNSLVPVEFVKDPVKSFKALSEKLNTAGPAGEALSLLWILILVLLIAYIAGLLLDSFGLGWVIHILLVIILVLLILWLLRIL